MLKLSIPLGFVIGFRTLQVTYFFKKNPILMKHKYTLAAFIVALLSISLYFSFTENKAQLQVEALRTQHQYFLDNSPFKESQKLSRDERKAQGLPPNSFNEPISGSSERKDSKFRTKFC